MSVQRTKFSTFILDRVLKRKKSENERLRKNLLNKTKQALEKLYQKGLFKEAYIFGSVTKPFDFTENSDIDVGFIGLKDEDYFKVMSFLSRELERDVDIIQMENHRLASKIKEEGIRWIKID